MDNSLLLRDTSHLNRLACSREKTLNQERKFSLKKSILKKYFKTIKWHTTKKGKCLQICNINRIFKMRQTYVLSEDTEC